MRTLGLAVGFALIASFAAPAIAAATNLSDFTVTLATGGSDIPPSSAGGAWTTLAGPVINVTPYSNPDVFPTGMTFTLTLPPNFEWNTAVTGGPTIAVAPDMPAGFCTLVASHLTYVRAGTVARSLTFVLSGTHDVGCTVSFSRLQLRPVSARSNAGSGGNITVDWTVPGVGASRAMGGVVTMASAPIPPLPPTDETTPARGPLAPLAPLAAVILLAALVVAFSVVIDPRRHRA